MGDAWTESRKVRQRRLVATPDSVQPQLLLAWAIAYRRIQDRATGQSVAFTLSDYPWLRELYELEAARVVIRKGAQLGVTEYAVTFALWAVATRGLTVFYAMPPGGGSVSAFSHTRLAPAITDTPMLYRTLDIDNVELKTFARGSIHIRGTNITVGDPRRAQQLAGVAADVAVIDEFDRVPPAAIPLVRDRTKDSRYNWQRDLSTPSVPGFGIDSEYQTTDMREPQVRCDVCNQWRRLDVGLLQAPGRLVCPCGALLNIAERWQANAVRYIAQAGSAVVGYWFPGLLSPRADLGAMWRRMHSDDPEVVQAFWNNDMGLAYEPKGAKLTEELLAACARAYTFPALLPGARAAMGVDVQGNELHVYVKGRGDGEKQRALWIGTVPDFADLDGLMARYDVACCVIDAMPEIRSAQAFVGRFVGRAYLGRFVNQVDGNRMATFHGDTQSAHIDRTKAILASHDRIERQIDELPADWRFIAGFLEQMTANVRVRTETAQGQVVYKFPKTGRPDHFDLAKAYAEVAMENIASGGSRPLASVQQAMQPSRFAGTLSGGNRWR